MRVALQPLLILALGLVAAQDIAGNSARGIEQVDNGKNIADRELHGIDLNAFEARAKKTTKKATTSPPKTTTKPVVTPTTSAVVQTTSSQKPTSTSSAKLSTSTSKSSLVSSTTNKASTSSSSATFSSTTSGSSSSSSGSSGSSATSSATDFVTSSSSSITSSGTQTSTGTETGTSTSSSSTGKPTSTRKWCNNGGSCSSKSCEAPVKPGSNSTSPAIRRSHPAALAKRTFVDPVKNWAKIKELPGSDLSKADFSEFIEFDDNPSALYIDGLIGCTAIGVFSQQGMQAYHLWESPAYHPTHGGLLRSPVGTLWPANNQAFVKQTLANAKATLSENKDKFEGGELVIMLPMTGSDYRYEVDTTYKWSDKTKSGTPSKSVGGGRMVLDEDEVQQGKGVVDMIKTMAKEATGINTIKECRYIPNNDDLTAGRFVVQYDPKSAGNKKAVQVWCEKARQYTGGWTW